MSKGCKPHCYRRLDITPAELRNSAKKDAAVKAALDDEANRHGLKLEYGEAEYINDGEVWGRFLVLGGRK